MHGRSVFPAALISSPRNTRGFTLVELVAVLVIIGAVAAVALPMYRSFKFDARVAAMRQVEAAVQANMQAAMTAYLARGSAGPVACGGQSFDSVVIGGRTVSVFPTGSNRGAAGAPTRCGMAVMLGCNVDPLGDDSGEIACPAMPAMTYWHGNDGTYSNLWPRAVGDYSNAYCWLAYYASNHPSFSASLAPWGDEFYGSVVGVDRNYFSDESIVSYGYVDAPDPSYHTCSF